MPLRTAGGEVVEDMGELEGAVADADGRGHVVVGLRRRRCGHRRGLGGGLALPGRIASDHLGPGLTGQRRQRCTACPSSHQITESVYTLQVKKYSENFQFSLLLVLSSANSFVNTTTDHG